MPFDIHIYSSRSIEWLAKDRDKGVESVENEGENVTKSSLVVDDVFHLTGHVGMNYSLFGARGLKFQKQVGINPLFSAK